jgi:hypothetical protein
VVLGGEHVLQLAVVEEDPAAVLALLDVHSLSVDRAHPPVAFGTSHANQDRGVVGQMGHVVRGVDVSEVVRRIPCCHLARPDRAGPDG